MSFPSRRPRRLRSSKAIRDLVAETGLTPSKLVLPVFVKSGIERPVPTPSLPGHSYYPPESRELLDYVSKAMDLGVRAFLFFGVPSLRDPLGSEAWSGKGPVQRSFRAIRREVGWEPVLMADICICGYTDHGHCGVPVETPRGRVIDNDKTLDIYARMSVSMAESGADVVAPSGMMDGQVAAIRRALDGEGHGDVAIMSYSSKYASSFYGPFRGVMDSAPRFGDRRGYQMDPRNAYEAVREAVTDVEEGADIVMVKPALAYLDVIRLVKSRLPDVPLAAYNVSGEYSMVKHAAEAGAIDGFQVMMEILYSIKRAGADIVITYHALEAADALASGASPF